MGAGRGFRFARAAVGGAVEGARLVRNSSIVWRMIELGVVRYRRATCCTARCCFGSSLMVMRGQSRVSCGLSLRGMRDHLLSGGEYSSRV